MKKIVVIITILFTICSKSYGYTDVNVDHWAYNVINTLSNEKFLTGYPDGSFKPEEKMTRAEFIALFSRAMGLNIDVSRVSEHWADVYINDLKEKNIIDFSKYSEFKPDDFITRWEICNMIINSFPNTKNADFNEKLPVFTDIDVINIEEQRVAKILKDTGVLSGYTDGTVGFYNTSTRAEVSKFIYNLINNLDEVKNYGKNYIYENNVVVFNVDDENIMLKKYEFAEDNEYCTTMISSIEMFEFNDADKSKYNKVFEQIYTSELPYFKYRNKFGEGNYILAIDFKTRNNTSDYSFFTGYPFLHISSDEKINIIDAFDLDEIDNQMHEKPYNGKIVEPGETLDTSAFYVLDKLPENKIYINRSITTLYDNKNMNNIDVTSFHSAVIYL